MSIDDSNADKLKSLLFTPLKIIHIGEIIVISIGVTIILATLIAGIVHRIRNNRVSKVNEPVRENTNNLGSDQVRHKPGCTVPEDG